MGHVTTWGKSIQVDGAASADSPLDGELEGSQWIQGHQEASVPGAESVVGTLPGGLLVPPSVCSKMPRPRLMEAWRTDEPQGPVWGEAQASPQTIGYCRHLGCKRSFQKGRWSVSAARSLASLPAGDRCQWRPDSRELDHPHGKHSGYMASGDLGKAGESRQRSKRFPFLRQLDYQVWTQISYTNFT